MTAHRPDSATLTADEVAALIRVERKTLYDAAKRGQIPGAFRVGRLLRFKREVVLEWLRSDKGAPERRSA